MNPNSHSPYRERALSHELLVHRHGAVRNGNLDKQQGSERETLNVFKTSRQTLHGAQGVSSPQIRGDAVSPVSLPAWPRPRPCQQPRRSERGPESSQAPSGGAAPRATRVRRRWTRRPWPPPCCRFAAGLACFGLG